MPSETSEGMGFNFPKNNRFSISLPFIVFGIKCSLTADCLIIDISLSFAVSAVTGEPANIFTAKPPFSNKNANSCVEKYLQLCGLGLKPDHSLLAVHIMITPLSLNTLCASSTNFIGCG